MSTAGRVMWDKGPFARHLVREESWLERALCRGMSTSLWYPGVGNGGEDSDCAAAKEVCAVCPVRSDCLEYALRVGERCGIWGGHSERERRRIRRKRAAAAAEARRNGVGW